MIKWLLALAMFLIPDLAWAEREVEARITVLDQVRTGWISPLVFGANLIGYDPTTYESDSKDYRGYSDFGEGIWDPESKSPNQPALELLRRAGIGSLRFPGGCGTHHYDWKQAIGPRGNFRFGLHEFLEVAQSLDAEPVITVSYFAGEAQDAADLVEYLNAPNDGSNPNDGVDWAQRRADHGYPLPYGVKYFEIGNEVWHGDHQQVESVAPEEYAKAYLARYHAMKSVDPRIEIGVLLHEDHWDDAVIKATAPYFDFGVQHFYFSAGRGHAGIPLEEAPAVFRRTMAEPDLIRGRWDQKRAKLSRAAGREIHLAITEFNTAFHQEEPVPYRHTLGAALVNAEILKILTDPSAGILMAQYWDFFSRFWGAVNFMRDVDQSVLSKPLVRRPNYYVYELYAKMGERALQVLRDDEALSVSASTDRHGALTVMVIHRGDRPLLTEVMAPDPSLSVREGEAYVLSGPAMTAHNEENPETVKVDTQPIKVIAGKCRFEFPPHSLTLLKW